MKRTYKTPKTKKIRIEEESSLLSPSNYLENEENPDAGAKRFRPIIFDDSDDLDVEQ